jgi:hypothetical protein
MVKAPRWCVVGAAVMLLVGPAAGRTLAGSVPKALLDRAAPEGTVRVLVQLQVAAEPEGGLASAEAVAAQRKAIAVAQSALMAELVGTRYRLIRTYETIPFLALEVSSDALRILEASPLVVGIEEDRLELPLSTPSRPTSVEPCLPVAPNAPPQQK